MKMKFKLNTGNITQCFDFKKTALKSCHLNCFLSMLCVMKQLTLWGRVTQLCFSKLTIVGSDNDLFPDRQQALSEPMSEYCYIPLGANLNEIFIEIHIFSNRKIHLEMLSGQWRPFYLGLNALYLSEWQGGWRIIYHWITGPVALVGVVNRNHRT